MEFVDEPNNAVEVPKKEKLQSEEGPSVLSQLLSEFDVGNQIQNDELCEELISDFRNSLLSIGQNLTIPQENPVYLVFHSFSNLFTRLVQESDPNDIRQNWQQIIENLLQGNKSNDEEIIESSPVENIEHKPGLVPTNLSSSPMVVADPIAPAMVSEPNFDYLDDFDYPTHQDLVFEFHQQSTPINPTAKNPDHLVIQLDEESSPAPLPKPSAQEEVISLVTPDFSEIKKNLTSTTIKNITGVDIFTQLEEIFPEPMTKPTERTFQSSPLPAEDREWESLNEEETKQLVEEYGLRYVNHEKSKRLLKSISKRAMTISASQPSSQLLMKGMISSKIRYTQLSSQQQEQQQQLPANTFHHSSSQSISNSTIQQATTTSIPPVQSVVSSIPSISTQVQQANSQLGTTKSAPAASVANGRKASLKAFLRNQEDFYDKILSFTPLKLDEVYQRCIQCNQYIERAELLDLLDSLAIFVSPGDK